MMRRIRSHATWAALAAAVCALSPARTCPAAAPAAGDALDKKAAEEKERQLIAVIQSDAPPQDKAVPCKQLAIYGSRAAVPALAALLSDKDLASWARIALEAIPDPAADDALRQAMGRIEGRLLIGVINSLGVRRDAKAVGDLSGRLGDADAEVACAAAEALGRIGGDGPAKALEQALGGTPPAVRTSVAYGCVLCAERLAAEGKADQAAKLYDAVRKADVPKQRVLEATRGAILARGAAGVPMLVELLGSADKALFGLGLRTVRELPGPEATAALAAELAKAAPDRQALLLLALADRGGPEALPAVLQAAKTGQGNVRIVAVGVLERLGDASCVPVLLEAAVGDDAELAKAARTALGRLSGQGVDAEVLARLPKASGKMRQALIELAGLRRIAGALPAIMQGIDDPDAGVRAAALTAVGAMGGRGQIADLLRALHKAQDADRPAVEKALMAISVRGGAACVPELMPLARNDSGELRIIALHALACAGGPDALGAVKAAIDDSDEAVQDEAARTLSTWPNNWPEDAAAAAPLLELARSAKKVTHKVLALRGYMQFIQANKKLSDQDRLAKVKEALPLIARPEEKRLAVSALAAIRTAAALETLVALTGDPGAAEEACSAIVNLAGPRGGLKGVSKPQQKQALQAAADKTKNAGTRKKAEDLLKALN